MASVGINYMLEKRARADRIVQRLRSIVVNYGGLGRGLETALVASIQCDEGPTIAIAEDAHQ